MAVLALGISHRHAEVPLLERLAFADEDLVKAYRRTQDDPAIGGAVVLSTCNRVEIYGDVPSYHVGFQALKLLGAELHIVRYPLCFQAGRVACHCRAALAVLRGADGRLGLGQRLAGGRQGLGGRFASLLSGTDARGRLDLDPGVDWVKVLLEWPESAGLYGPDNPFDAMWSQGTPQRCLREMKAWCDARSIALVVTLWPFLQGLGPGRHYPFERLHQLVADDCKAAGIPFVDLLPALRGTPQEQLWVTPSDMHPNPKAQRLVIPVIAAAVAAAMRI